MSSWLCFHHPFLSVGDYLGLRSLWVRREIDANVPSLLKAYSLGNGWWTGEYCGHPPGPYSCWPLWSQTLWPNPPAGSPAPAYVNGFLFVHNGQETLSPENEQPLGYNSIRGAYYCCNRWPSWDPWPCDPFAMVVDTFPRNLRRERTCSVDGTWNYDTRY